MHPLRLGGIGWAGSRIVSSIVRNPSSDPGVPGRLSGDRAGLEGVQPMSPVNLLPMFPVCTAGRAVHEFCEHYHGERNHQGLGNKIIEPDSGFGMWGEVQCRKRLGGLLRYYYRDAA